MSLTTSFQRISNDISQNGLDAWTNYQLSKIIQSITTENGLLSEEDLLQIFKSMRRLGKKPRGFSIAEVIEKLLPPSISTVHASVVRRYVGCADATREPPKKGQKPLPKPEVKTSQLLPTSIEWESLEPSELQDVQADSFHEASLQFQSGSSSNNPEHSQILFKEALKTSMSGTRFSNISSTRLRSAQGRQSTPSAAINQAPQRADIMIVPSLYLEPEQVMATRPAPTMYKSGTFSTAGKSLRGPLLRPSVAEIRSRPVPERARTDRTTGAVVLTTKETHK